MSRGVAVSAPATGTPSDGGEALDAPKAANSVASGTVRNFLASMALRFAGNLGASSQPPVSAQCHASSTALRSVSLRFNVLQRRRKHCAGAALDWCAMTAAPSANILVVDDEPDLRQLLSDFLTANGFSVTEAADGTEMRARLAERYPDAIVLDLMLPGEDGLSLARELRRTSDVPILMLSALGEELDRVVGLEVGADDYLAKPFSPRELVARLRALLRRARPHGGDAPDPAPHAVPHRFGPFTLDVTGYRLMRGDTEVPLTTAEFQLLRVFVEHPHRVLSRDNLIEKLKGYSREAFDRSVDVRVTRLRRKIEADPARPAFIRTVRGEGYLFNPEAGAR
jgi:two-component system phosphate regulon response regulator OmpR